MNAKHTAKLNKISRHTYDCHPEHPEIKSYITHYCRNQPKAQGQVEI